MIIDELVGLLTWKSTGDADLKRFQNGMRNTIDLMQRLSVVAAAAGAVLAGAMAAVGKGVIETSAQFEGFQVSLETIEGSSEKAKASMAWIQKFATQTPYDLEGVTRAFVKLKSYGIDPTDGTLMTLGDTASAMNKPLDAAVEALADAMTFQFERLKEFGITSSQKGDEVTFTWRKNGKELTKVVKKNGAEIKKFMMQTLGDSFSGAMIRQSKTWNGMMANLGDAWTNFKKRIGDGGFFENMKSRLANLLDRISALADDGTLGRWADNISSALTKGADFIGSAVESIIKDVMQIADFFAEHSDLFGPLKWALLGLGMALFPVTSMFAAAALAIDDFLTYLRGGDSVIGTFIEKIKEIAPRLKDIDWAAVGKSMGEGIVSGIGYAAEAIAKLFMDIDWAMVVSVWIGALKAQFQFINGVFQGVGESIGNAILAGLTAMGGKIQAWFESILPEWAADFFAFRAKEAGALNDKATEAGNRRRQMEGLTKPYNPNLTLPEAFKNYQGNTARSGAGLKPSIVNAPTSVTINMPVQQVMDAAVAAGKKVTDAVGSKLSTLPSHPTRTTPSPTF